MSSIHLDNLRMIHEYRLITDIASLHCLKIKTKGKKVDVYGVPKLTTDSLLQTVSTFHAIDKKNLNIKY